MSDLKFRLGDKVKVVDTASFAREAVIGDVGTIIMTRKSPIGLPYGVEFKHERAGYHTLKGKLNGKYGYWCSEKMLKLVHDDKIVIYREGNKVIAKNTMTKREGVAKCSPEDTFDFNVRAKLAFERLLGKPTFRILALEKCENYFNKGDVIEFENGVATWCNGRKSSTYANFNHFISRNICWKKQVVELKPGDNHVGILNNHISVGDTVRVINTGRVYTRYNDWLGLKGYESHFVPCKNAMTYQNYIVLNIAKHENGRDTLVLIQNPDTTQVFIVGIEALKKEV